MANLEYGEVVGKYITSQGNPEVAAQGSITFHPYVDIVVNSPEPATVVATPVTVTLDGAGEFTVTLSAGYYLVKFDIDEAHQCDFNIEVKGGETLNLNLATPIIPPPGVILVPSSEDLNEVVVSVDLDGSDLTYTRHDGTVVDVGEIQAGLKEYANLDELDVVVAPEVGLIRDVDMGQLDPVFASLRGDLVIETVGLQGGFLLRQTVLMMDGSGTQVAALSRGRSAGSWSNWNLFSLLPGLALGQTNRIPSGRSTGGGTTWTTVGSAVASAPDTIPLRDSIGRAQFATPDAPLDAANKAYVDAGSIKTYATAAELDAVQQAEFGLALNVDLTPIVGLAVSGDFYVETMPISTVVAQIMSLAHLGRAIRISIGGAWQPWNLQPDLPIPSGGGTSAPRYLRTWTEPNGAKSWTEQSEWVTPPGSGTASGNTGEKAFSSTHLYICVAPNSWRRIPLETF